VKLRRRDNRRLKADTNIHQNPKGLRICADRIAAGISVCGPSADCNIKAEENRNIILSYKSFLIVKKIIKKIGRVPVGSHTLI